MDIVSELFKETSYLDPYLRQFFKYLKGKDILTIGEEKEYLSSKIKDMGFNVENTKVINKNENKQYDGIILFNTLNEIDKTYIPNIFGDILSILNENGYLFIVIRLIKEGSNYTKEFFDVIMESNYNYIEELSSYDNLKFYIYAKNTIK